MDRFADVTLETIKQIAKTPAKEIERRRINLWFHRFLYYKYDTQMISDFEYDKKEIEYRILREHYSKVRFRESCPLICVGTDADAGTAEKVERLISYWQNNKITNIAEQKPIIEEPKIALGGQVLLFGTNFLREG